MCKYILYIYNIYIYICIHTCANPCQSTTWETHRKLDCHKIGQNRDVFTTKYSNWHKKKCGFCRGNSKDGTYIYSRVLLYFTVLSFGYYMFNLSFTPNQTPIPQPNQWSYPRQVAGRQVALVQRWIATHCADHNRNGHREYGDANVLWSRARRGQFSSLAKQWKFWNGGHGEKKKKQTIPTRDPKQCVVRILKWKVERTENHQWLAGPERP